MRQAVLDAPSQPFRNFSPFPKWDTAVPTSGTPSWVPFGSGSQITTDVYDTTDLAPPKVGRTRVHTAPASGKIGHRNSLKVPIVVGSRVRASMWLKSSVNLSVEVAIEWTDPDGTTYRGSGGSTIFALTANVWTQVSVNAVAPATAGFLRTWGYHNSNPLADAPAGSVMRVGPSVITIDQPLPVTYVDGDTPGWRWMGTVGGSESVGYPYTLESIAGKPFYFGEDVLASATPVVPSMPGGPLTIVAVQQVPAVTTVPGLWDVRRATDGQNQYRSIARTTTAFNQCFRLSTDNGWEEFAAVGAGPTAYATVASVVQQTSARHFVNGGAAQVHTYAQPSIFASGFPATLQVRVGSRDGAVQSEAPTTKGFAIFDRALNDETAIRVSAWFARRYGTLIPSGY